MALLFKRRNGEGFWVGDAFVRVKAAQRGGGVNVAVTAPKGVRVMREEIDAREAPDHGRVPDA